MSSYYVQSGIVHPIGGFPMMRPSPHASNWQFHTIIPKQEPIDQEERQDSGINSGSDFQSSSPGSDPCPSPSVDQHPVHYYSTPVRRTDQRPTVMDQEQIYTDSTNPLTPPSSEPMSPPNQKQNGTIAEQLEAMDVGHAPCSTPELVDSNPPATNNNQPNHLKILEKVLEENQLLPPQPSPKANESAGEDDKSPTMSNEDFIKELKTPKVNSHGKVRTFKCKQCDHVAITKWDYWDHCKVHIRPDKRLMCRRCPFVTELKHHLEFHVLNHEGVKPFKCEQCEYSCVNKSMLTSHMKSHSNIYPYHCGDCVYATKYCHSLKTHLRKYKHKPGVLLNPDGTPNPTPVIDVYGKRRGPKIKQQQPAPKPPVTYTQDQESISLALSNIILRTPQMPLPFPGMPFFPGVSAFHPLLLQNLENVVNGAPPAVEDKEDLAQPSETDSAEALDLSKPAKVQRNRRKGRAVKLLNRNNSTDDELTTMFSNVEVVETEEDVPKEVEMKPENDLTCQYCSIKYGDPVLYTMHMGYHGFGNPFTCNMCGEACGDKISFFMHMARNSHP